MVVRLYTLIPAYEQFTHIVDYSHVCMYLVSRNNAILNEVEYTESPQRKKNYKNPQEAAFVVKARKDQDV